MTTAYLFSNWQTATSADKTELLQNISSSLGSDWEIKEEQLLHKPSDKRFAFIPGGWMQMGMSPTDLFHAASVRSNQNYTEWYWNDSVAQMRPSVPVYVYPFLMAVTNREVDEDSTKADFEIISDAEFEWVASSGKQTSWIALDPCETVTSKNKLKLVSGKTIDPFGVQEILDADGGICCADSWHSNHIDRPQNSLPWGAEQTVGREAHTCWQDDDEEVIAWHVSYRIDGGGCHTYDVVRLHELFPEIPEKPEQAVDLQIFQTILENGTTRDKKTLLGTLSILSSSPAEDIFPLFDLMLKNCTADEKLTAKLLQILADITVSKSFAERFNGDSPFSPYRKKLGQLIDANIEVLLPLLNNKKKPIRLAVVDLLSATTDSKAYEAIKQQYEQEKNKEVLEACNIAVAFWVKNNNKGTLLHELLPNKKLPEYYPELMRGICHGVDVEKIIGFLKAGSVLPEHFQLCVELLKASDQNKEMMAVELAHLSLKQKEKEKGQLQKMAFDLSFPDCSLMRKGTSRQSLKSWLLLPDELTENQRAVLKILVDDDSQLGLHPQVAQNAYYISRVAMSLEGRKIQLGESDSVYAQKIEFNGIQMPLLFALHEIVDSDHETAESRYLNFLSQFDLITLYEIVNQSGKVYYDNDLYEGWKIRWAFFSEQLENDTSELKAYLKPKLADYFFKERNYETTCATLVRTSFSLYKNDQEKWSWFMKNLITEEIGIISSYNSYEIRAFSYDDMRIKVLQLGNKLIEEFRAKGKIQVSEYDRKYCPMAFLDYVQQTTSENLVAGILALAKADKYSRCNQYVNEKNEFKPFQHILPKGFLNAKTGKENLVVFEKLWKVFTGDENFKL